MKKNRIISIFLCIILLFSMAVCSFAEGEVNSTKKVSIISANVSGLPIPSTFAPDGKIVPKAQKIMGKKLNESGIDIVCVQEDFQFHGTLAKEMTNYPYQTYTSGGVPVGDGMNIFSKYPIYNVERIAWETFNGILDAANDGLTPKGLLKCTIDFDGVLIDVYNIHVDANGSYEDCMAKKAQFIQLCNYVDANSAGRPVMITGDMNVITHGDIEAEFYPIMIQQNNYRDGWTEYCNDGVYFTGYLPNDVVAEYDKKFGGYYWGHWDSVERLLIREDGGVKMKFTDFRYDDYNTDEVITDHNVMVSEVELDLTDYVRSDVKLDTEIKKTFTQQFTYSVKMFFRCLRLILQDLFAKIKAGEIPGGNN